jgi:hypothetical protein
MKNALNHLLSRVCVCLLLAATVGQLSATNIPLHFVLTNKSKKEANGVIRMYNPFETDPAASLGYTVPPQSVLTIHDTTHADTDGFVPARITLSPFSDQENAVTASLQGNSFIYDASPAEPVAMELNPDGYEHMIGTEHTFNAEVTSRLYVTPDFEKTIWKMDNSTLNGDVYREGIDKVVFAINDNAPVAGGGGGGGTMGTNATGSSVEDMAKIAKDTLGNTTETVTVGAHAAKLRMPAGVADEAAAGGDAAATAAITLFQGAAGGDAPTELSFDPVGGAAAPTSILSVHFPAAFGGAVFEMNPFTEERLGGVASWFRDAIAWLTVVLLGSWIWNELDVKAYQTGQMQQARGNTVAGSGGQITAFIAAGLLTIAVVALATALIAWGFNAIGFSAFRSSFATNPMGALASGAVWMLNQILPVPVLIAAALARLSWKMYSVPLFAGCIAVCRFVVV